MLSLSFIQFHFYIFIAMIKMKGCIEKSAEIMGSMNKLVNVKEISETMRDMAREMERVSSLYIYVYSLEN